MIDQYRQYNNSIFTLDFFCHNYLSPVDPFLRSRTRQVAYALRSREESLGGQMISPISFLCVLDRSVTQSARSILKKSINELTI